MFSLQGLLLCRHLFYARGGEGVGQEVVVGDKRECVCLRAAKMWRGRSEKSGWMG